MLGTYYLVLVGSNDAPLYELFYTSPRRSGDQPTAVRLSRTRTGGNTAVRLLLAHQQQSRHQCQR